MHLYVDFIVKVKDENIDLLDTKSGFATKVAGPKAQGLAQYIKQQNKKGESFRRLRLPKRLQLVLSL